MSEKIYGDTLSETLESDMKKEIAGLNEKCEYLLHQLRLTEDKLANAHSNISRLMKEMNKLCDYFHV